MVGKKSRYDMASCSVMPAIKGVSPYTTQNEQLDTAINAAEGILPNNEQTLVQRMGDILEPVLCEAAKDLLGLDSVKIDYEEPVKHHVLPLMGSLDATGVASNLKFKNGDAAHIIIPEQDNIILDGPGVIECKATRNIATNDIEEWRGVLQAKSLMECTGYNWAAVIVLWQSTDFRIYLYQRKLEFAGELSTMVLDFDYRIKTKKYYNPVNTNDANLVYKNVNKDIIKLGDKANDYAQNIFERKNLINELKKQIDEYEVLLKDMIQDNEAASTKNYLIKWPMINYKAAPEKIIPAKAAKQLRSKTLRIKEYE